MSATFACVGHKSDRTGLKPSTGMVFWICAPVRVLWPRFFVPPRLREATLGADIPHPASHRWLCSVARRLSWKSAAPRAGKIQLGRKDDGAYPEGQYPAGR